MLKRSHKKIKDLPFNKILPNMVTLFALCSGVTAIRFAMDGDFKKAVACIVIASIFDVLDGRVARMLRGTTDFGAELDSLSDLVCFGVAPGLLMYSWALSAASPIGWIFALILPVCSALRLARFNVMLDDEPLPEYWKHFFVGVPAPAGAFIALLPILLFFQTECTCFQNATVVESFLFVSAFLMVSRVPTLSSKHFRVPANCVAFLLAFAGLFAGALMYKPWLTISAFFICYLVTLPVCFLFFLKLKAKTGKKDNILN